ncbi:MAG: lysophospholipase [Bacteroidota bacterium]
MQAEAFSWTTADQLKIYGVNWPCAEPVAVVGLVHGLGEHVHRYEHLVEYLHSNKIAAIGYDRRGHGQSEGKKGHTSSYDAFLDEIAQLLVEAEQRYPNVPVFLYGHSMGGNLLLNYVLRRNPSIKGAIVSAPHIRLAFEPPAMMVALGKMMKGLYPGFTQPNGLAVDQLSRDQAVVDAYIADPLVHDKLTAITGMSMLDTGLYLDQFIGEFPVPLLLMHGGEDGITSAPASREFGERISGNVQVKIWDGLFHEIHNEPEQQQVFDLAGNWIKQQLA